jgi:hypothetical protein
MSGAPILPFPLTTPEIAAGCPSEVREISCGEKVTTAVIGGKKFESLTVE